MPGRLSASRPLPPPPPSGLFSSLLPSFLPPCTCHPPFLPFRLSTPHLRPRRRRRARAAGGIGGRRPLARFRGGRGGVAWRGTAWRRDPAPAWPGSARRGAAWRDVARHDIAWRDVAFLGGANGCIDEQMSAKIWRPPFSQFDPDLCKIRRQGREKGFEHVFSPPLLQRPERPFRDPPAPPGTGGVTFLGKKGLVHRELSGDKGGRFRPFGGVWCRGSNRHIGNFYEAVFSDLMGHSTQDTDGAGEYN